MLLFRKVTTYTGHQDITDGSLSTTQAPPQIEQAIHTKDVTDTQYIYLYIYRRQSKDIRDIPQISHAICRSHSHSIEASQQFHVHTDITANPHTSKYIYKLKNRRASRALFFLLGCAKPRSYMVSTEIVVLDSIEWKDRRFRPRFVGAVLEAWEAEDEVWKACRFS